MGSRHVWDDNTHKKPGQSMRPAESSARTVTDGRRTHTCCWMRKVISTTTTSTAEHLTQLEHLEYLLGSIEALQQFVLSVLEALIQSGHALLNQGPHHVVVQQTGGRNILTHRHNLQVFLQHSSSKGEG